MKAWELLEHNPRVFWGRAIGLLIERGWSPPPPDERIVDELLADMERLTQPIGVEGWNAQVLTESELRISLLVAEGLTNREIADELHVVPQTVKFHLNGAYRKLGVRNRTELATMVAGTRRAA